MQAAPALQTEPVDLPLAQMVGRAFNQALREAAAPEDDPSPPLLVKPAVQALGLRHLAARHPGGSAAQRQALVLYTRCLQHYRQRVQPLLGAPRAGPARPAPRGGSSKAAEPHLPDSPGHTDDDLGHAAAYFVLVNLAVLEGREPDARALPAVERQLRRLLGSAAEWARCGLAERQQGFEQLASLAVLVNESRLAAKVQGPDAASHVREAARNYLRQMLGLDAERLTVSAAGLAWAEGVQ